MTKKILLIAGGLTAVLLAGIWLGMQFAKSPKRDLATDSSETLPYRAGRLQLAVDVEPEAPVVGENRLRIRLRDADGEPVQGAEVRAVAEMPAMGAMPAMQAPADLREIEPGVYAGPFELSMGGSWPLTLQIEAPGLPTRTIGFDMATGRKGLSPSAGLDASPGGAAEEMPPETITIDARRRQLIEIGRAHV